MYEGMQGAIVLSIISMVIVFIVLGLLALLMVGLRKFMAFTSKKPAKDEKGIVKGEKAAPVPKETTGVEETANEEIVGVISAAVASYLHSTTSALPLSIISIKRIIPQTLNYWAISGRQNMMTERISISSRKKGGF
ncbi:MAG TPA: OadG family protein [Atribacterota bacterium]|nr:OadG family protein [Atribacterota bacterium]